MDEEAAFLEMILAQPDDDGVRLIYADWLEDRGDVRGDFLRLECQLHRLPPESAHSNEIRQQLAERFGSLSQEWVAAVSRAPIAGCQKAGRAFWCQLRTWATLRRVEGCDERFCDDCKRSIELTNNIETVRKVGLGLPPKTVAVDPRVVLSREALQPTEKTMLALRMYEYHEFQLWALEPGAETGEGTTPQVGVDEPPF